MSNQLQITGGAKVRNLEGVLTGTSGVVSSLGINVPSGIPQLDGSGKILVSQLPNSVMEYKGTWNAATNTPTLANGTGNAGDVYICEVAGTVNFGAGPITFYVSDQVIYSGTIWQRASGSSGTVLSVGISSTAPAITISNSPITTSGNIGVNFSGNSGQYVSGDGNLVTFPTIITQAQNLVTEVYNNSGATITKGTVVYINGGQGNLPTITKAQANTEVASNQTIGLVRADITNMNNGYVTVAGTLNDLNTNGFSVGNTLYLSPSVAGGYTSTKPTSPDHIVYIGIVVRAHPTQGVIEVNIQNTQELAESSDVLITSPTNSQILQYDSATSLWKNVAGTTTNIAEGTNLYFTDARARSAISLTTTGTSGASTYNSSTGVLNIPQYQGVITNPVTGVGSADQVAFWNSASNITYDSTFYYSSSNKRLGVNTNTPNATIGSNIGIDSGFGLLVKNADNNYNGLGIGIDSSYGNLISSVKIGTAATRNITILNQSGYHSLTEAGSFGLNILTPAASPSGVGSLGIDVYGGSNAAGIGFHNVASGVGNTNGAYIYLTTGLGFTLRNLEGGITSSSLGDFSVITNSTENFRVNSSNGSIWQSNVSDAMLKTVSGVLTAAVAGTDYVAPSALSGYVPTSRTLTINGTAYDLSADRSWSVGTLTGGGADGRVAFWNGATNVVSDSLFVWDDTNNRLGIGLNNPQRSLEIYTTSPDTHLRLSGAAPSVSMGEAITGSIYQAKFGLATANNQFVTGSVAGDFVINNQTGSTIWAYNSTEKMRLDTNGNLGVGGIANSSYRLHVFGTAPMLGIESTTTGNVFLRMLQAGTVVGGMYYNNSDSTLRINNNNGGLRFDTSTVNGALTIASTGAATFSSSVTAGSQISILGGDGGGKQLFFTGGTTKYNFMIAVQQNLNNGLEITPSSAAGGSTFNTPAVVVTGTGNVGIGTSSPSDYIDAGLGLAIINTSGRTGLSLGSTQGTANEVLGRLSFTNTNSTNIGSKRLAYISGVRGTTNNSAYLEFGTADNALGTQRMVISQSGNVGIGTSSPNYTLHIDSNTTLTRFQITNSTTGQGGGVGLQIIQNGLDASITNRSNGYLGFETVGTERMRIYSEGQIGIKGAATTEAAYGLFTNDANTGFFNIFAGGSGTATKGIKLKVTSGSSTIDAMTITSGGNVLIGITSDGGYKLRVSHNNTVTSLGVDASNGDIYMYTLGTGTVYSNSGRLTNTNPSDRRLKENILTIEYGLNEILKLNPVSFYWKNDNNKNKQFGFIAQEVQEVMPNAVIEGEYLGLEKDAIYATLVKAIQELSDKVTELENKLN